MNRIATIAASVTALVAAGQQASAIIDLDYYESLDGLRGSSLKNAVHEIVTNSQVSMLSYGSGKGHTWDGFYDTDYIMDGSKRQVVDRYSNDVRYFGSRGAVVSGMNIEHSVANSWWGGTKNNAYKDLFELMPSEAKINSTKSNYAMSVVVSGDRGNGCTKVGKDEDGNWVWEPADKWKGDFARDYFYIFTAYQDLNWQTDKAPCGQTVSKGSALTLKQWAYELYLQWARADKVSEMEVNRNDQVEKHQHNRNPFVDFPNLMEYIWGDSTDINFNLKTTVKSAPTKGGSTLPDPDPTPGPDPDPTPGPDDWVTIYANTLLGDEGNMEEELVTAPEGGTYVWTNTQQYGWKGSAFISGKAREAEAILWTPEFDFSEYRSVRLTMDHSVNYAKSPASLLSVIASPNEGEESVVTLSAWPAGSDFKFIQNVTGNVDDLAGKKGSIGFRYTSNTSEAPMWEIKNLKIEGLVKTTGIEDIEADPAPGDMYNPDSDFLGQPEYYTLDGRRIGNLEGYHGLVIVRRGSRATKLLIH